MTQRTNGFHEGYNIMIMPTADECWSYVITVGIYPTLAYGDVLKDDASFLDVFWGATILAWGHATGGVLQKKWNVLPGLTAKVQEAA